MWEMDSNEYVYFYVAESPDAETVKDLIETAPPELAGFSLNW